MDTGQITPPATGSSHINVGNAERAVSLVGGALLTYFGLRKPNVGGIAMAAAGGAMLFRGTTGFCPLNDAIGRDTSDGKGVSVNITRSLTINRPRNEVFQFWRQLENLPQFMSHLEEVRQLGPKQSHWVAKIPKGVGKIAWDAHIIREEKDSLIAWSSLPGSDIDNAGEVQFMDSPSGQGTLVRAMISYRPPVGVVGGSVAKLLNPKFEEMVDHDLQRFKQLMEANAGVNPVGEPAGI